MNNNLKELLEKRFGKVKSINLLKGGDTSEVFKIETENERIVVKTNSGSGSIRMFEVEKKGLELLAKTNTIGIPKVYGNEVINNESYLFLEFIETKPPDSQDFAKLGSCLRSLHNQSSVLFGLDFDNWIGSLEQKNTYETQWQEFYINHRLWPQMKKSDLKHSTSFTTTYNKSKLRDCHLLQDLNIKPKLLHGDLWSGNFVIKHDGTPYLIDPAVYYGDPLVDIAMSKLFGGFESYFYETYFDGNDLINGDLIEIYQLYYLLVHLNIFGASYLDSVNRLMKKHFG